MALPYATVGQVKNIAKSTADSVNFTVNYTVGEYNNGYYSATCDKTYEEVLEAYNSGKIIVANAALNEVGSVRLISAGLSEQGNIQFSGTFYLGSSILFVSVIQDINNSVVLMTPLAILD